MHANAVPVNLDVNNLLAIPEQDFDHDYSGEPGPQAKGANNMGTPLRRLHVTHRASSCAKRGGQDGQDGEHLPVLH